MFLKFLKFAKKLKSCVLSFCSLLNMKGMFFEFLSSKTKLNACFSRFFTFKQNRSRLQQVKSCFYSFLKFEACKKWNPYTFWEIFELAKNKTKKKWNNLFFELFKAKKWNPCFWSFLKLTKKINPWSWRFSSLQKHVFWAFKKSMFFELLEAGENWFHVFRVFFGCKKLNPCIYRFLKVIKSWIRVFEFF